jgi:drug/metabolite transporter (DMT)-like permease
LDIGMNSRRGDLLALSSAVLFGISGTVAADALATFSSIQMAQFRSTVAALVLGALAYHRRQTTTGGRLPELGILGVFLAAVTIAFYWAIDRLGVGPGVTIQFLGPTLVLFWMRFVQQRAVPRVAWLLAGLALGGTAMITRAWDYQSLDPLGVLAGLGAAFMFAGYLVIGERLGRRLPGLTIGAYGFAVAAVLLLVAAPVELPRADAIGWTQLGWIAIGGTVIPFMLSLGALRIADPGRVGVLHTLEPAVAAASAWVVLGQVLGPVQVLGGLLVILSIAAIQRLTSTVDSEQAAPQPI